MLILGVPNSPRWLLVERGDKEGALQTLQLLHSNVQTAQAELKAIVAHQSQEISSGNVFSGKYNKSLILAFLLAFFNQLSSINFICIMHL